MRALVIRISIHVTGNVVIVVQQVVQRVQTEDGTSNRTDIYNHRLVSAVAP